MGKEKREIFIFFCLVEEKIGLKENGVWRVFSPRPHKSLSKMDKKHGEKTWGRQNVKITPTFPSSLLNTHSGKHKYFLSFHFSIIPTKQSLTELYHEEGVISILITCICCWFLLKKKMLIQWILKRRCILCVSLKFSRIQPFVMSFKLTFMIQLRNHNGTIKKD